MNTWNRHIHTGTQNVHNVHIGNIGIRKHKKHLRLLSSSTKLLITFELKGFSTSGDRYTIFLCWLFHLPPPHHQHHVRHPPQGLGKLRKSTVFRGKNSTHWLFSNPQNPPRMLPVHDVIHTSMSYFLSGIFILTSLNDISSPHARERLRSCCT